MEEKIICSTTGLFQLVLSDELQLSDTKNRKNETNPIKFLSSSDSLYGMV